MTDKQAFTSTWEYLDVFHSIRYPIWEERHALRDIRAGQGMASPATTMQPLRVLLVPGFLDDGRAVQPLASRLNASGHAARVADIGRNIACGEVMLGRLIEEIFDASETLHTSSGQAGPIVLIGHSRGGTLSRAATVRHPELVDGLITLGSPLSRPHGINLPLRLVRTGMRIATRLGVPGLVGECPYGSCCSRYTQDVTGPFPDGIPFVSFRGIHDGMVARDAVEDDAAQVIDVDASHAGLPVAPDAVMAVEAALARFALGA